MGVTIHYKGKLNSEDLIDPFCEEMEDIARSMEWEYNRFDFDKSKDEIPLKGLIIKPHKSAEPLQFMIDKSGNLRNVFLVKWLNDENESSFFNHIKTQFAPFDVHIAVIKLLKYLQQKYMLSLEVWDEGDYWQTGDAVLLKEKMDFLNEKMDQIKNVLHSIEFEEGSSAESVADKIEEILKKMNFRKQ